jgi:hypothetical protein
MSRRALTLILLGFCIMTALVIGVPAMIISNSVATRDEQPTNTGILITDNIKEVQTATANGKFATVDVLLVDPNELSSQPLSGEQYRQAVNQIQTRFLLRLFEPDFKVIFKDPNEPVIQAQLNAFALDRVQRSRLVEDVTLQNNELPVTPGP